MIVFVFTRLLSLDMGCVVCDCAFVLFYFGLNLVFCLVCDYMLFCGLCFLGLMFAC